MNKIEKPTSATPLALSFWIGAAALTFLSTNAVALDAINAACKIIERQACGDCDFDTAALRKSISAVEVERKKLEGTSDLRGIRYADICLLRGRFALGVIHLAPQRGAPSTDEREKILVNLQVEKERLLRTYPRDKEILLAVLSTGELPDRLAFTAYSNLAELDKTNSEARLWASYYALQLGERSWRLRMKSALKVVTNAQLYRNFIDLLVDTGRQGRCDAESLKFLERTRSSLEKIWEGVDADTVQMTPKMLRHANKLSDELGALRCK